MNGILGIRPVELTVGTVSNNQPVPTVADNLYEAKLIPKNSIGISYTPTLGTAGTLSGETTFGGEDSGTYVGELSYVPVTSKSPAGSYWGIDQSISYGPTGSDPSSGAENFTPILETSAGILDTGTTLLYLASDAFKAYQKSTGAELHENTGLLKLSTEQFKQLGSLYFFIGGQTYVMVPDAQIWPKELNTTIGGDANAIFLVAADNGTENGSGLDFINGFVWRKCPALCKFHSILILFHMYSTAFLHCLRHREISDRNCEHPVHESDVKFRRIWQFHQGLNNTSTHEYQLCRISRENYTVIVS